GARAVQSALANLDAYIAATQLGITLASLAPGWVGGPAIALLFDRMLAPFGLSVQGGAGTHSVLAIVLAFTFLTILHIVLGELTPRSLALVRPEGVSRIVVMPLMAFAAVMRPFTFLLNGVARWMLRLVGIEHPRHARRAHSPEELRLLVLLSHAHGTLDASDALVLAGVFDFLAKKVRDVMRPRTEVTAIPISASEQEVRELVRQERYSRYPVYRETLDDVA